jgi:hypothetical protein
MAAWSLKCFDFESPLYLPSNDFAFILGQIQLHKQNYFHYNRIFFVSFDNYL